MGFAFYVYTRDLDRVLRVGADLEAGLVGVNTGFISDPVAQFGGAKQSGLGKEGGVVGIEEFLSAQYSGIGLGA